MMPKFNGKGCHMATDIEVAACNPKKVLLSSFNHSARIPHGVSIEHVCAAMNDFIDFIGFINQQLSTRKMPRMESFLMPANFSSIVGEFMSANIPKYCESIVKNQYHNGHPDMIPAKAFPNNAVQYAHDGIEIKASRYLKGWQGHNAEDAWLMVFCFESSRPTDNSKGIKPRPFEFRFVAGAKLSKSDWTFNGRSETSRRTITATVNPEGYKKMITNWIYRAPDL